MPEYTPKSQLVASSFILFILVTGLFTALQYFFLFGSKWLLVSALLAINVAAFLWMGLDKGKSAFADGGFGETKATFKGRVPEMFFYLVALLGGSPGILLAAKFFRHKINKNSFLAVVGGILFLQFLGIMVLVTRG